MRSELGFFAHSLISGLKQRCSNFKRIMIFNFFIREFTLISGHEFYNCIPTFLPHLSSTNSTWNELHNKCDCDFKFTSWWLYENVSSNNTPFISPNSQSLRTELHFQFIRFAAAILQCASVCFHTEHRISAFWKVRFKKRSKIEQKDIITPMHCLAFPSALFGAPFHIDNRTVADCGFWLEYASKTPLEVVADLPHRMRLFWLRCQIMRLRSVHIKTPLTLHYWLDMKGV